MYAIVDIAGQQLKVEEKQKIFVNRLEGEEGSKVDFDKVLLVENDGKIQVGMPIVGNFIVSATILSHMRGDTVKVFKKKRRKGYQKLNGHRQYLTQLLIESIGEGKIEAKAATKKVSEPKTEVNAVTDATAELKTKADTKPTKAADPKKESQAKAGGKSTKSEASKKQTASGTSKEATARKKPEQKVEKKAVKTSKDKSKE